MKKMVIKLIRLYQKLPGPWHNSCRHIPTCSNYAIEAITLYGVFKGGIMSIKRIVRCNPFGSFGYDPVVKEEFHEKN
ncbi:MAG: membrane protein insertion efficiency factor YidD [Bacilli bacterium]|nr:membrane protein insertion efficiency factor YidD [Bacilli bacterium]